MELESLLDSFPHFFLNLRGTEIGCEHIHIGVDISVTHFPNEIDGVRHPNPMDTPTIDEVRFHATTPDPVLDALKPFWRLKDHIWEIIQFNV